MSSSEVASYLERLVRSASNSPYVEGVGVISRFIDRRGGYLRFRADFIDGSRLFAFEFVDARLRRLRYSYHYQDASGDLIFRYDNAPHHPEVRTHPHHKHTPQGVVEAESPRHS